MECNEFRLLLRKYEELGEQEKLKLAEHAEKCDECANELAEYMAMVSELKAMPKLTAPANFLDDLNYRIDAEDIVPEKKPINIKENLRKYSYRYGAIAACVALVAVIGVNSKDMVDKMMQRDDDGVISEVTATVNPSTKQKATVLPSASPKAVPSATPEAKTDKQPAATAKPNATAKVNATVKPKTTTAPKSNSTAKPLATAVPQKTQSKTTAAPTAKPVETKQEVNKSDNDTIASFSEQNISTEAPKEIEVASVTPNAEIKTTENPNPSGQNERSMNPDEYTLPDAKQGRSNPTENYKVASNSIEVSYAYADRAREILNAYAIGSDGATYYSMDPDDVDECLQAMTEAGIEFNENCIEMDDDMVIFRLIIS